MPGDPLGHVDRAASIHVFGFLWPWSWGSKLQAVANGSVVSWQHINLLCEYDFSDDKLQDSVGIKPPKLATWIAPIIGGHT